MDIIVTETCEKEILGFPEQIRRNFLEVVNDLKNGVVLSMPLSRKMEGMPKGTFEIRLKERSGNYRVIYILKKKDAFYFVHAFQKKTKKTPKKNIDLALKRIRRLL